MDGEETASLPKLKIEEGSFSIFFEIGAFEVGHVVEPLGIQFKLVVGVDLILVFELAAEGSFDLLNDIQGGDFFVLFIWSGKVGDIGEYSIDEDCFLLFFHFL